MYYAHHRHATATAAPAALGTSTAREERVVMIVLGFTITLDLWVKVGERVMHADALGGLA